MNYFLKIDQDLHPERKKYLKRLNLKNYVKNKAHNNKIDKEILSEIVHLGKKFNKKQILGGTWDWVEKKKRGNKNNIQLDNGFEKLNNFFRNDLSFGLISSHWKRITNNKFYSEKVVSDILKNISAWEEFTKTKDLDYKLLDSNKAVGNPYGLIYKNNLILYDTPRHDYYANKIKNLIFTKNKIPTILEIGGGYGGLLSQLIKRNLKFNYINIDLFKTLQVAYYFIRKEFKKKIHFSSVINNEILNKNDKSKIIFVPYDNRNFWKSNMKVDILFNSNSFSEMGLNSILLYFKIINSKIKPKYILHQNTNLKSFTKLKRYKEIPSSEFPIDKINYELKYFNPSIFQGGSGRYREYLYKRKY